MKSSERREGSALSLSLGGALEDAIALESPHSAAIDDRHVATIIFHRLHVRYRLDLPEAKLSLSSPSACFAQFSTAVTTVNRSHE